MRCFTWHQHWLKWPSTVCEQWLKWTFACAIIVTIKGFGEVFWNLQKHMLSHDTVLLVWLNPSNHVTEKHYNNKCLLHLPSACQDFEGTADCAPSQPPQWGRQETMFLLSSIHTYLSLCKWIFGVKFGSLNHRAQKALYFLKCGTYVRCWHQYRSVSGVGGWFWPRVGPWPPVWVSQYSGSLLWFN